MPKAMLLLTCYHPLFFTLTFRYFEKKSYSSCNMRNPSCATYGRNDYLRSQSAPCWTHKHIFLHSSLPLGYHYQDCASFRLSLYPHATMKIALNLPHL